MRPCTPTRSAPSATGRQHRLRRRPKRARRQAQIGAGTDTPTPVRAEGHCTGARQTLFSLDRAIAQPLAALPLTDAAYPLRVKRNARKEEPVEHW